MDLIKEAQISGIEAQSLAQLRVIAQASGDKGEKKIAMQKVISGTVKAINKINGDK
jgi:hypothetical protein